ncbi:unnamed protein product [Trifolium pratense]|uniref:Uncharacterized protein n=1 Tax=Trifolium pratense TaxID=57577 RepID=A0ACB0M6P8_TRIPR|nr:unnamed protein product [Trifolium pratense]
MMMVLKGVNLNDRCSWCHYLDCIPFLGWSCKYRGIDCDIIEIGNSLSMTCKSNGKNRIFPLKNGIPPHSVEELCFRLCQA